MIERSDTRFLNPVWHALRGPHRRLAIGGGGACRYPADVAPFAALGEPSAAAQRELHSLLGDGEPVWIADSPSHPGLAVEQELDCVQMVLPGEAPLPPPGPDIVTLSGERLRLEGYPELSGICTHAEHRGRGFAAGLIGHLAQAHRREGQTSWLHVGAPNTRAIDLYLRLGFMRVRNLMLRRISRTG